MHAACVIGTSARNLRYITLRYVKKKEIAYHNYAEAKRALSAKII